MKVFFKSKINFVESLKKSNLNKKIVQINTFLLCFAI